MSLRFVALVTMLSLFTGLISTPHASADEPLAAAVKESIDKGVRYLKFQAEANAGRWDSPLFPVKYKGGMTCLATLALLTAGEKPTGWLTEKKVLSFIRELHPTTTYVVGLQTMVLAEVNDVRDITTIRANVEWLLKSRVYNNGKLAGWWYEQGTGAAPDNSNTQYALLGLYAGKTYLANHDAKSPIQQQDWEEIQRYYIDTMQKDGRGGGWAYQTGTEIRHTMTMAGLSGLFIAGLELDVSDQQLDEKTGIAAKCGTYKENQTIANALKWLDSPRHGGKGSEKNFTFITPGTSFYNIYGIERVGRLSGERFLAGHDWYREGCELLTGKVQSDLNQKVDGSWEYRSLGIVDGMKDVSTSFALLFLAKGRTPNLVSKLAYDTKTSPIEWNRKHNDTRHMVEYASQELFKKQPLSWQVYDPREADLSRKDKMNDELSTLLLSPVLYINGHEAPELTEQQIILLQRYVEEGGFIFAEACCGSKPFTKGFIELMEKKVLKGAKLTPLRPDHPIWKAHFPLDPAYFQNVPAADQIMCIEMGCKTVAVLTPQPMAGFWEEKRFAPTGKMAAFPANRGEAAYRFMGNVLAYATGLEMPKFKLSNEKIVDAPKDVVTRHELKIGQVKVGGESEPAPQAMRNLAMYLRAEPFKLDVAMQKDTVRISKGNLAQYKFMYMHGRNDFAVDAEDVKNVRNNLLMGGTLLGDACCGSPAFDKAFRGLCEKLWPDKKLERIPLDDFLYSDKLNGKAITSVRCRTDAGEEFKQVPPELEGIKVGERWVVIYSKYDLGCALEKNKSSACRGHDFESAERLAGAAVLYSLKK